jgi:hypothetical protein
VFCKIACTSFGGGMTKISLIEQEIVDRRAWPRPIPILFSRDIHGM